MIREAWMYTPSFQERRCVVVLDMAFTDDRVTIELGSINVVNESEFVLEVDDVLLFVQIDVKFNSKFSYGEYLDLYSVIEETARYIYNVTVIHGHYVKLQREVGIDE